MASEGSDAAIIQTADELLKKKDWKGLVRYLEREAGSTRNHELLWRALRAHYRCSKSGVPPGEEAQGVAEAGMRYYETVQSIPEKHQLCEKWCGVLLSHYSDLVGQKMKIEKSFVVRDHFKKAIELDPTEASCQHLMGRWCFNVASVPWLMRKAASYIFATPPTSSFEEALSYLEAAENAGFLYSPNWLFMGKCFKELGQKEKARLWLKKVVEKKTDDEDELEAKKEAEAILIKL